MFVAFILRKSFFGRSVKLSILFFRLLTANGTRARLVHGASVQDRDSATVAEEDQTRRTADGAHGCLLLLRIEHGANVAQLHGGPVSSLFLRSVGTAADGHVSFTSVQERQVCC